MHLVSSVVDTVIVCHIADVSTNIDIQLSQLGRRLFIRLTVDVPKHQLTAQSSKPLSHQTS